MRYATLDDVKHHLRYDDDASDEILSSYLFAATRAVNNYITEAPTDDMIPVLKVATLLMVGYLDDNRNAERGDVHGNYLPASVRQLLAPYRKPTI